MLLLKSPPFGMQQPGGSRNRPVVIYPDNGFGWPDLSVPIDAKLSTTPQTGRVNKLDFRTDEPKKNGVYHGGGGKCVVTGSTLVLDGDGGSDFSGVGAGAMVEHDGELVLMDCDIHTAGVTRPCAVATKNGVLRAYRCTLTADGGTLPQDYVFRPGPGMQTPPPALGIGGNCRAHLSMDGSRTYYHDCRITAAGWGALSTDAGIRPVYLEANHCEIEVTGPGYGAYSDNNCEVVLNSCTVNTATHTLMLAGLSRAALRDVRAVSGRHCAMIHNVMGVPTEVAELTIEGGDIRTEQECFLLKSTNSYLDVRGARLCSKCGVLLRAVVNEDECATKVGASPVFGNNLVLSDLEGEGAILNEDTDRVLTVTLSGAVLTGRIQNAYLGMDQASRWYAAGDSTVVLMGEISPGQLDAPVGVRITAQRGDGCMLTSMTLPSGGTLSFQGE